MFKKIIALILTALLVTMLSSHFANAEKPYVSGVAVGFPPYQFKSQNGETRGFDADVLRLLLVAAPACTERP